MAYPSTLARTKNWGTEVLTDTDLEGQFDLIIAWVLALANNTTGHSHSGSTNQGPKIDLTTSVTGVLPIANGGTGVSTLTNLLSLVYPIGVIYTSVVSTNPNTVLGFGTWTAFGAGKVLVGVDSGDTDFDTVEETGGAKTVTLTGAQSGVPAHTHNTTNTRNENGWSGGNFFQGSQDGGNSPAGTTLTVAENTAADAASAHNNVQPYICVYFFKRTA